MIDTAIAAQVIVWLIVIGVFLAGGEASLFHPVTWYLAFHGLVFVLRPILVHVFGFDFLWNYMGFHPTDEIFVRTLAVTSVGLVVFAAACLAMSRRKPSFTGQAVPELSPRQWRGLVMMTLLLLPMVGYSIFTTRNGIAGERVGAVYINTNSVGYLNDAQFAIMPLLCIWLVATRFHWLNVLPVALYLGYRIWFGWARFTIVLFVVMVVAIYCWQRRKCWMPLWAVAAAVPLFLLFNLIGHNRDVLKQLLSGEEVRTVEYYPGMTKEQKIKTKYDNQDAANFDSLAFIIAVVPERTGTYSYGAQYLQLFTEPIPRILWKGKPRGAPVGFFDLNDYGNFLGLTPSLVGDGWMSGGLVGVIATLALVGGFLGWAHRWFWNHEQDSLRALFYLTALPMLAQWYRDGGISVAKFMLWSWLPLVMWAGLNWLMGKRQVPAYSMLLPRGARIRFVQAAEGGSQAGPK
jgi:hypothetical protein